jgi:hypothetical protein
MPTACSALADWISRAGIQPGTSLFRSVNTGGEISTKRLSDRSVARIIKKEVRKSAIAAAGRSEAEANELAELCSGHSLRAGYCAASAMLAFLSGRRVAAAGIGLPRRSPDLARGRGVDG